MRRLFLTTRPGASVVWCDENGIRTDFAGDPRLEPFLVEAKPGDWAVLFDDDDGRAWTVVCVNEVPLEGRR